MWQLEAQDDQGDQHPVGNHEPVAWAGPGGTLPRTAPASFQGALVGGIDGNPRQWFSAI